MGLPNSSPPIEHLRINMPRRHYNPLNGLYGDVEIRLNSVDSGINDIRQRIREFERLMDNHTDRCETVEKRIKVLRDQFADIDREVSDMIVQCQNVELNNVVVAENGEESDEFMDEMAEESQATGTKDKSVSENVSTIANVNKHVRLSVRETIDSTNRRADLNDGKTETELTSITSDNVSTACAIGNESRKNRKDDNFHETEYSYSKIPPENQNRNNTKRIEHCTDKRKLTHVRTIMKNNGDTPATFAQGTIRGQREVISDTCIEKSDSYNDSVDDKYAKEDSLIKTEDGSHSEFPEQKVLDIIRKYTDQNWFDDDRDKQDQTSTSGSVSCTQASLVNTNEQTERNTMTHTYTSNFSAEESHGVRRDSNITQYAGKSTQLVSTTSDKEAALVFRTTNQSAKMVGFDILEAKDLDISVRFHKNTICKEKNSDIVDHFQQSHHESEATNMKTYEVNNKSHQKNKVKGIATGIQTDNTRTFPKGIQTDETESYPKESQTDFKKLIPKSSQTIPNSATSISTDEPQKRLISKSRYPQISSQRYSNGLPGCQRNSNSKFLCRSTDNTNI